MLAKLKTKTKKPPGFFAGADALKQLEQDMNAALLGPKDNEEAPIIGAFFVGGRSDRLHSRGTVAVSSPIPPQEIAPHASCQHPRRYQQRRRPQSRGAAPQTN